MAILKQKMIVSLSVASFMLITSSVHAQFDFGRVLEGQAQEAIQQFGNQIRGELQRGLPQVLPYDPQPISPHPVEILPYPQFPEHNPPQFAPIQTYPVETYPVQPQPVRTSPAPTPVAKRKLPKIEAATVINMSTKKYGTEPGKVYLKIGKLVLNVELVKWTAGRIEARLPYMPMQNSAEAVVIVLSPEKRLLDQAEIELTPSSKPAPVVRRTAETTAKPKIPTVSPGQHLNIKGQLGEARGSVELRLGGMTLPVEVLDWNASKVSFVLPEVGLAKTQAAQVVVLKADGVQARLVDVKVAAAAK